MRSCFGFLFVLPISVQICKIRGVKLNPQKQTQKLGIRSQISRSTSDYPSDQRGLARQSSGTDLRKETLGVGIEKHCAADYFLLQPSLGQTTEEVIELVAIVRQPIWTLTSRCLRLSVPRRRIGGVKLRAAKQSTTVKLGKQNMGQTFPQVTIQPLRRAPTLTTCPNTNSGINQGNRSQSFYSFTFARLLRVRPSLIRNSIPNTL